MSSYQDEALARELQPIVGETGYQTSQHLSTPAPGYALNQFGEAAQVSFGQYAAIANTQTAPPSAPGYAPNSFGEAAQFPLGSNVDYDRPANIQPTMTPRADTPDRLSWGGDLYEKETRMDVLATNSYLGALETGQPLPTFPEYHSQSHTLSPEGHDVTDPKQQALQDVMDAYPPVDHHDHLVIPTHVEVGQMSALIRAARSHVSDPRPGEEGVLNLHEENNRGWW